MKLQLYPTLEDAHLSSCASDGDNRNGIPRDTCEHVPGLVLLFENHSARPQSIAIGKTVKAGVEEKPYDMAWYTIMPATQEWLKGISVINPMKLLVGPFDEFVPTEDLADLGAAEGDFQITYLSGIDGLFVAAIGRQ